MKSKNAQVPFLSLRNILIIIFIVILLYGVIIYALILKSCFFLNCVEKRSFNALDLALPLDLFPDNAIVNRMHRPSESYGAFEAGSMTFYWQGGNKNGGYHVLRFRTEEEASRSFLADSGGTRFIRNQSLFHHSSIADEFAVGCGYSPPFGYRCNMAARYQEYAIHLIASIDSEMRMEMFNEVIIFIDQEMERRLYGQVEN